MMTPILFVRDDRNSIGSKFVTMNAQVAPMVFNPAESNRKRVGLALDDPYHNQNERAAQLPSLQKLPHD